jgi:hypothetical protein
MQQQHGKYSSNALDACRVAALNGFSYPSIVLIVCL